MLSTLCVHQETKRVLVELSRQPVSVVVVGVGRGDMSSLVALDSDRARLSAGEDQAARDIVQFVGRQYEGGDRLQTRVLQFNMDINVHR